MARQGAHDDQRWLAVLLQYSPHHRSLLVHGIEYQQVRGGQLGSQHGCQCKTQAAESKEERKNWQQANPAVDGTLKKNEKDKPY